MRSTLGSFLGAPAPPGRAGRGATPTIKALQAQTLMNRSKEASVFGPNMEIAPFSEYTHTPTLGKLSEIYEKRLSNEGLGSYPRENSPALSTLQVAACLGQTGSAESRYRTDVCKRYDFGVGSTTRASNRWGAAPRTVMMFLTFPPIAESRK